MHFKEGDVVPVGAIIAIVDMDGDGTIEEAQLITATESAKTESATTTQKSLNLRCCCRGKPVDFSDSQNFIHHWLKALPNRKIYQLQNLMLLLEVGKMAE